MVASAPSDSRSDSTSDAEQKRPLIRPLIRIGDEEPPELQKSSNRLSSRYSMGSDVDKLRTRNNGQNENESENCCFGLVAVKTAACLIAVLEVIIVSYHMAAASLNYDKGGDDYAFTFTLLLFSLSLALIAILLLLIGIKKLSAFFLVPHLLMQFAVIIAWLFLACYVMMLLVGGTSIRADVVIYENSRRGELALQQLNKYGSLRSTIDSPRLNFLLALLLAVMGLAILFQAWCFTVVKRCFSLLRKLSMEKTSRSDSLVAIPVQPSSKPRV